MRAELELVLRPAFEGPPPRAAVPGTEARMGERERSEPRARAVHPARAPADLCRDPASSPPSSRAYHLELREGGRVLAAGRVELPVAELLGGLETFAGKQPSDQFAWQDHGVALFEALRPVLGGALSPFLDSGLPARLLLCCEGCPELLGLAWETLAGKRSPIVAGGWELVRLAGEAREPAEPIEQDDGGRLRVLLLVGSLEGLLRGNDAALAAFRALSKLARENQLELDLAASVPWLGDGASSFFVGRQPREAPDERFLLLQRGHVRALLARERYHVVHVIGHSDPGSDPLGARALRFDFSHRADAIEVADLALDLAPHRPALAVVQACAGRAALAFALLAAADHVVTFAGYPSPELCAAFARGFYAELAASAGLDALRVGPAMRAGRARLFEEEWREQAFMPAHFARTADDVVFDPRGAAVRRYCAAVETHERDLVQRFGRRRRRAPLGEVHVPLLLVEAREEQETRAPGRAQPRALAFAELLALDTGPEPPRWIVRGGPGAGKTTTLRHRAYELARSARRERVPILLRLKSWIADPARPGDHSPRSFLDYLGRKWGVRELGAALDGRADLVLLLDGWDELSADEHVLAADALAPLEREWKAVPIAIAARSASDVAELPGAWREAALQGIERREHRQRILEAWFRTARGEVDAHALALDWADRIERGDRTLLELGANPLMLTILADLILARKAVEGRQRHELLREVVTCFLEGDHSGRSEDARLDHDAARAWLAALAWTMTRATTREAGSHAIEDWMRGHASNAALRGKRSFRKLLERIAEHTGLLQPVDDGFETWEWPHRLLQEALCAEHWLEVELARRAARWRVRAVLRLLDAELAKENETPGAALDFWTEPTALVGARIERGDGLLVPLLSDERRRDLGLRVMQSVRVIGPKVARKVVASAVLPAWRYGIHRGVMESKGPRVLAYELLAERASPPSRAIASLAGRARAQDLPRAELGALVECLDTLGRREGARADADSVIAAILNLLPRLTAKDVPAHFSRVPGHAGEALWRRAPATGCSTPAFRMGDEGVEVSLGGPYWIAAVPVTLGRYRLFEPRHVQADDWDERVPAVELSWFHAALFCRWLEYQRSRPELQEAWCKALPKDLPADAVFRLPTEAEWEYACRAGTPWERAYWKGDGEHSLHAVGWYSQNSEGRLHRVAELEANPFGLYDVHGNVGEWCNDWYAKELRAGPDRGGPPSGSSRMVRGGSIRFVARGCRSAVRLMNGPGLVYDEIGFRVVLAPPSPSR